VIKKAKTKTSKIAPPHTDRKPTDWWTTKSGWNHELGLDRDKPVPYLHNDLELDEKSSA
jgi:hypothetical protein